MKNNPCLGCRMRDKDKNNSLCLKCEKRVGYVQQLEQELNFSASYSDTGLYVRFHNPLQTRQTGRLRMAFDH